MNIHELKMATQRKLILKIIRDDFNGSVQTQGEIFTAMGKHRTNRAIRANLDWLVENGYLTLTRTGSSTKSYTLTEKAT